MTRDAETRSSSPHLPDAGYWDTFGLAKVSFNFAVGRLTGSEDKETSIDIPWSCPSEWQPIDFVGGAAVALTSSSELIC